VHPLQKILEEIVDNGEMEYEICSYSGRCMYGVTCLAITGDDINAIQLGYLIMKYDLHNEIYKEDLSNIRQDSMGLGIVLYFPNISYVEENKEGIIQDEV
jgi:hypothetical protein